ncbi:hypothetical protein PoB_004482000 [Plakobranchus ocellatus]|uniref:Uncharacterized protein n=1 Tax=Plakobranchus ocellatus TaxID=259542 RepID=A0AAV4BGU7_9GAST|nr:hypothetical protein PoB_004482000 [Plakobranchus ocellatus]
MMILKTTSKVRYLLCQIVLQVWDEQVLVELRRSANHYDHSKKELKIKDPNQVYDMTRHPGYKQLSASDVAVFSLNFTPGGDKKKCTMFPQSQCADLCGLRGSTGCRFPKDVEQHKHENSHKFMADWPIIFVKTKNSDERYGKDNDGGVVSQLRLAYFQSTIGHNGMQNDECMGYRHPRQGYIYRKEGATGGTGKDMCTFNPQYDEGTGVTPNGKGGDITTRPPYFTFGVHPDFERKASGIFPYNYFANLNVTYFSTVEWLIASPAPSWIPLGPGGVKNIKESEIKPQDETPIKRMFAEGKDRVIVGGRYDGSFHYGANYI